MILKNFKKLFCFVSILLITGCSSSQFIQNDNLSPDTIKAGRFDTGRMWTFDFPPLEYFAEEYNFEPDQEWLDNVRLSTLRFATYCSASFISEDGLIMTNNHCARESAAEISGEGEELQKNGFYAQTTSEERPVPGLFVEQLVLIKDVTDEIQQALDSGTTEQEKISNEEKKISEIEERESKATGLSVTITPLYYGGKYSLYGYKRYTDVRLVFTPEHLMGHFGGEYDNFTYPRYNLDFALFRVYDEGKPLKTNNYFKWSEQGAKPGELVFAVGNPGSTSRLSTVAQLEYNRDVLYPKTLQLYESLIHLYDSLISEEPDSISEDLYVQLLKFMNAQKVYKGMIEGLNDTILIQRKKDFENSFKAKVKTDEMLNKKYANLWDNISEIQYELIDLNFKIDALTIDPDYSPLYFYVAQDVIDLAYELIVPEEERMDDYKKDQIDSTIEAIIPEDYEHQLNKELLRNQLDRVIKNLGSDDPLVQKISGGLNPDDAVEYMLDKSVVDDPGRLKELIKRGSDAILNSGDLFIYYVQNSIRRMNELEQKSLLLNEKEEVYNNLLGRAFFETYGTSISPDATFTLRISDGVIEGYPYNGTIAPPFTTFYGLYDRYFSFENKEPWELPEKWKNPPAEFNLETPFNFVSTNDITGGSSGSPVINRNAEIVGVAFDGNIESIAGNFIFMTEQNRMVSVHSAGIIEALSDIYNAARLVNEMKSGKIVKEKPALTE